MKWWTSNALVQGAIVSLRSPIAAAAPQADVDSHALIVK